MFVYKDDLLVSVYCFMYCSTPPNCCHALCHTRLSTEWQRDMLTHTAGKPKMCSALYTPVCARVRVCVGPVVCWYTLLEGISTWINVVREVEWAKDNMPFSTLFLLKFITVNSLTSSTFRCWKYHTTDFPQTQSDLIPAPSPPPHLPLCCH